MNYKSLIRPLLILLFFMGLWHLSHPFAAPSAAETVSANVPDKNIILVPLDGRPPCRQFPVDAGAIANTNTIFNLGCSVLLFPLLPVYERLSRKIIRDEQNRSFGLKEAGK